MALNSKIEMIIAAREKDLGGFSVRRVLPYATHRMVGPFIFFDHMGPAKFEPGKGMDVRPHPHINLATVTYLFEGRIQHKDSLGFDQAIEPGAINWMTAGKGIVHSERTPDFDRKEGIRINGIQLWVALPEEHEEIEPSFIHYPKNTLPEFRIEDATIKLLLGKAFKHRSPVKVHSDLFYAEIKIPKGGKFNFVVEGREAALYVVDGRINIEGQDVKAREMAIGKKDEDLLITAVEDTRFMALGGHPIGERFIYWNFVSSSKERLEEAKRQWANGPSADNPRFHLIPTDDKEFIPLPASEVEVPKGTIM